METEKKYTDSYSHFITIYTLYTAGFCHKGI